MAPIKPSIIGMFDIFAGILLLYTQSALPTAFADIHAGFLIFKGAVTQFPIPPLLPLFVIGNAADIISAAIIFTGKPPIFGDYKEIIALFLFQKGVFGFISMLSY
ncbi:MAG: hypothetical protein BRC29_04155 [Nanohaloarchaea archaeon SW_7_43_1]|nr:MAG: hypothetical protein BRC29_04155 [Nanohaloarchaea archaeon SW_7_43_1]